VASLEIKTATEDITIINVYNPRNNGPRIQTWPQIAQALDDISQDKEIILLGDLNAHHPQ
jgi:exonuclease III